MESLKFSLQKMLVLTKKDVGENNTADRGILDVVQCKCPQKKGPKSLIMKVRVDYSEAVVGSSVATSAGSGKIRLAAGAPSPKFNLPSVV